MRGRRVYGALTGEPDRPAMAGQVVNYAKFVGFSATALALTACVELAPAELGIQPSTTLETRRLAALEGQVKALGANVARLRQDMAALRPVADQGNGLSAAAQTYPAPPQFESAVSLFAGLKGVPGPSGPLADESASVACAETTAAGVCLMPAPAGAH